MLKDIYSTLCELEDAFRSIDWKKATRKSFEIDKVDLTVVSHNQHLEVLPNQAELLKFPKQASTDASRAKQERYYEGISRRRFRNHAQDYHSIT